MCAFEDNSVWREGFSGVVRLFPVPNLVMFPHVVQPLHVSEPRYRYLLNDALQEDRLIALAILAPGWETDYEGRPRLRPYACLARVTASQVAQDGGHTLLLAGLRRVRLLGELPPTRAYRQATAVLAKDEYPFDQASRCQSLKRNLYERLSRLMSHLSPPTEQLGQLLNSSVPLGALTDVLSHALALRMHDKETLLSEVNVHRRAEVLLRCLARMEEEGGHPGGALGVPPAFSRN